MVSDGKNEYKLGWQSQNIKPVTKWINLVLCSIGIDQTFVIFEYTTGKILQKLSLDYYFYHTKISDGAIYVITQLEIIKISITDLAIAGIYSLPDYFESIKFNEGVVVVNCINGEVVNL